MRKQTVHIEDAGYGDIALCGQLSKPRGYLIDYLRGKLPRPGQKVCKRCSARATEACRQHLGEQTNGI